MPDAIISLSLTYAALALAFVVIAWTYIKEWREPKLNVDIKREKDVYLPESKGTGKEDELPPDIVDLLNARPSAASVDTKTSSGDVSRQSQMTSSSSDESTYRFGRETRRVAGPENMSVRTTSTWSDTVSDRGFLSSEEELDQTSDERLRKTSDTASLPKSETASCCSLRCEIK
ncbi:hypothetical protein V1264_017096 [Littorina saxatilis]|uniref:Uncharacterized protein n=1 Tax=Littorina saxatilis TaxID=31220 RepID=A0AAN9BHV6_9CAEN